MHRSLKIAQKDLARAAGATSKQSFSASAQQPPETTRAIDLKYGSPYVVALTLTR